MGDTPSVTNTFVAGTKAKAVEMNTNFSDLVADIGGGTSDLYANSYINRRTSNGSVSIGANKSFMASYFTIDTTATYLLTDTTSRMAIFGDLNLASGAALYLTSGAEILVL